MHFSWMVRGPKTLALFMDGREPMTLALFKDGLEPMTFALFMDIEEPMTFALFMDIGEPTTLALFMDIGQPTTLALLKPIVKCINVVNFLQTCCECIKSYFLSTVQTVLVYLYDQHIVPSTYNLSMFKSLSNNMWIRRNLTNRFFFKLFSEL